MKEPDIKKAIREGYGNIARQSTSCCGPQNSCGCSGVNVENNINLNTGYSKEEIESAPEGSNLGLGCGNPVALASISEGEVVLDLGSGAGFDCFLSASKVGDKGKVIGIDMTPEMVERARENAIKANYNNVEFRLGEIENLPVADNFVDVIISNCVINLSLDKKRVFAEAFRVLKFGGRLMVSDIVLLKQLPNNVTRSITAYISCIAGAVTKDDYISAIESAGFINIEVIDENMLVTGGAENDSAVQEFVKSIGVSEKEIKNVINSVRSIKISAIKDNS